MQVVCRDLYHEYEERKQAGYFEPLRPKTDRENVAEIKIMLEAVLRNQAGLAGLSRQGVFNDVYAAANATGNIQNIFFPEEMNLHLLLQRCLI